MADTTTKDAVMRKYSEKQSTTTPRTPHPSVAPMVRGRRFSSPTRGLPQRIPPPLSFRQKCRRFFYLLKWKIWGMPTLPYARLFSGPRPFYHAMRLIWPFPWYLPIPPQLPVSALLEDRGIIMRRKMFDVSYTELRFVPLFCMRDTPLRALYRLYECTCTVSENETMEEGMYIFHRQPQWRIKDIPDPKDSDPLRYAILASLTETMVEAFNYKIKLGLRRGITNEKPLLIASFAKESDPPYEEPPPWCATVGPLQDALILDPRFKISAHKHFRKRSIVVHVEQLWNV